MVDRLFSDDNEFHNPNRKVMKIPVQHGTDESDNYCASIGDATMQHVYSLGPAERMMYEMLHMMPDGNMFRFVPSYGFHDPDPENLRDKDLDDYLEQYRDKVDASQFAALEEAVQNEKDRRAQFIEEPDEDVSEYCDAFDGELIPYADWEKEENQGKFRNVDIPSTPKDVAIYMGNCRQMFYDEFPEGHPNSNVINKYLNILNRRFPEDVDEGYAKWVCDQLDNEKVPEYVRHHLKALTWNLFKGGDEVSHVKACLENIDRCWAVDYKNQAAELVLKNPAVRLIMRKEKEWKEDFEAGVSVLNKIKAFGSLLYKEFSGQMNGYVWARYRRCKTLYANKVLLRGIDLNRASMKDMTKLFGTESAQAIFFNRPLQSEAEAYNKGYITKTAFGDNKFSDAVVNWIEEQSGIAKKTKSASRMREVCDIVMKLQREKGKACSSDQWSAIWKYYKIMKQDVQEYLNKDLK